MADFLSPRAHNDSKGRFDVSDQFVFKLISFNF